MFKFFRKQLKNQKGFTLVELMVVVVIIGILIGIAVPVYSKVTGGAEGKACAANQRTIEGALQLYKIENTDNEYPDNLDKLIEDEFLPEGTDFTCPTDGASYNYDSVTGAVTCKNHDKQGKPITTSEPD